VNTICERCSRARSATTSIAAPRRAHERSATRSTISGSAGHSVAGTGWQYSAVVRGQVPLVRNTRPSAPIGSHTKNGNVLSGSGFTATSNSTPPG
jgi:hypothetical protein